MLLHTYIYAYILHLGEMLPCDSAKVESDAAQRHTHIFNYIYIHTYIKLYINIC